VLPGLRARLLQAIGDRHDVGPGTSVERNADDRLATELVGRNGFVRHWDAAAQAPYLWNADKRVFIGYDDPQSLREKCRFIRERGLAGAMFWEYFSDGSGALLATLHEGLRATGVTLRKGP
jgi:GH18 family chitinase